MIINHNMNAMNAHRNMSTNTVNAGKSMEKLSSGLRINKAGDDAAGLAISEKMRGQIRGLDQAGRNSQDAISLIQTAEGALNETHSILQRMRELSVQAANDTNTGVDRGAIKQEMSQLKDEIDRVGNTTEFNTKKLLNGGASVGATITGAAAAQVAVVGGSADTQTGSSVAITGFTAATADTSSATTATFAASTTALSGASTITINDVAFSFGATHTVQNVLDTINNAGIGVKANWTAGNGISFASTTSGSKSDLTVSGLTGDFAGAGTITQGADASVTITGAPSYTADGNKITIQSGNAKGLEFTVSGSTGAATISVNSNGGLNMQIGANENQTMYVSISDMRSSALGVNNLDVSTSTTAGSATTTIQKAIETVSAERSKLGAYQNRLEHTIANLGTSSENLQSAESRIRDVDMAKEMMSFSKNNILSQAAQAMLAQANQQPQGVLQLLR
jgi:flagellin